MPSFRGIQVAIVCGADGQTLPEFAHQDGSSVKLAASASTASTRTPSPESFASSVYSDTDSLPLKKSNPTISVYVPSLPGKQWWLKYDIHTPPHATSLLYFKLIINGINVTNWGVDLGAKTSGTIARALYEPCERWHYRENGTLFKRQGIESRTFCFMPDASSARRVGDGGGLVLVQAFRAKARKPRAVKLDKYRAQEKWGIASPSGGLLDAPEDAVYYDFLLVDCKESPYATFGFHYRSWSNMTTLNLVSPQEVRSYAAILEALGLVEPGKTPAQRHGRGEGGPSADNTGVLASSSFLNLTTAPQNRPRRLSHIHVDDEHDAEENTRQDASAMPEPLCITKSPPKIRLSPPERFSTPSSPTRKFKLPQPSKARRDLPVTSSTTVIGDGHADKASRKSSESHAPSITPSLLRVLDSERVDGDSDAVEYGVATEVVVLSRENSQSQLVATERPLPSTPQAWGGDDFRPGGSDVEYVWSMSRRGGGGASSGSSSSLDDDFFARLGLAAEWMAPGGEPPPSPRSDDGGEAALKVDIKASSSSGPDEWF